MFAKKWLFSSDAAIALPSAAIAFKIPVIKSSQLSYIKHKTAFRNLGNNVEMNVYPAINQPVEVSINNLLKQMNIEEKVGMQTIPEKRIIQSIHIN